MGGGGTYDVILTVTDDEGATDQTSIQVTVGPYADPTAVIDGGNQSISPGDDLLLDGSDSQDNDEGNSDIEYYEWDLEEGPGGTSIQGAKGTGDTASFSWDLLETEYGWVGAAPTT